MEVKELGHLVLYVRDIEASTHFYRDILGWQPLALGDAMQGIPVAAFSAPNQRTHHELLLIEVGPDAAPIPYGRRVGMYHFGDRKSTRLNSSHSQQSRMPSSA